tara:strand:- start:23873 stop:24046 length:174 start_codon:yes stop_codon:yes gene_type:complete
MELEHQLSVLIFIIFLLHKINQTKAFCGFGFFIFKLKFYFMTLFLISKALKRYPLLA